MRNRQQQGEKPGPPDMGAPDSPTPPSSGLASLDMSNDPFVLNASVKACSKLCFDGLELVFDVNEIEEFGDSPSEVARLTLTLPPSFKGDDPPQNLVDLPRLFHNSYGRIPTHVRGSFFFFSLYKASHYMYKLYATQVGLLQWFLRESDADSKALLEFDRAVSRDVRSHLLVAGLPLFL